MMTYQDIQRSVAYDAAVEFVKSVGGFLALLGSVFAQASLANRRMELVERLRAKSDEDLAQLGIKRDDIVQHVFLDLHFS
jgi:hypothetical protein